ncbi:MAG TPA: enoyl-CoA hydratase-related protein [Casimicrobiaceae bacterium]|nr:enoyl-CoA hydratase-related protein [Casimicrobiaceae bacterium]
MAESRAGGTILVDRDESIATITLNRPEKLNALTKAMWGGLGDAVAALSRDAGVRCIVVRGAGERAFSPGNDIAEFARERSSKAQAIEYGRFMHATADTLAACPVPMVAEIHGICVGGGLEIASLCDLRICGASSRFGAPIKNLGLVMAYAEMAPLVRLAGPAVALEILLEGRIFDAAEAKEKGLVTRVVPDDQVGTEARATALRIAEGAPLVARWHKKFVRRLAQGTPITADEADECFDCFDTEDFRAGYAAFLAKRKPQFHGR